MEDTLTEALNSYYKLKHTYDTNVLKLKRSILQDKSLSKTLMKQKVSELKLKCASCNQSGGTLFLQHGTKLIAKCNADQRLGLKPCSLNYEIDRGEYEPISQVYAYYKTDMDLARTNIVCLKLDVLFGYIEESQAIPLFQNYKEEYNTSDISIKRLNELFDRVIHNTRNHTDITNLSTEIYSTKQTIRELLQQYQVTEESQFIRDTIHQYIHTLYPQVKQLREYTYKKNAIECVDGTDPCTDITKYLIQEPYSYVQTEIEMSQGAIVQMVE
jgi:hypothetical protein